MNNSTVKSFLALMVAVAGVLLGVQSAQAATKTWQPSPTSSNWSLSGTGNWAEGTLATGDTTVFGTSSTTTLNNDTTSFSIAGMTFSSGASAFTINGNSITLTGNIANNGTSLETINFNIDSTATRTYTTTAGGGNITLGGNLTGAGEVDKLGAGTLTLSGTASSYTGGTRANAGTMVLSGTRSGTSGWFSLNNVGAQNAVVKVLPSANWGIADFNIAEGSNSRGAIYQSGGTITVNNNTSSAFKLGSGASSYGYYNLSGGALTFAGAAGEIGIGGIGANATLGVMDITGGMVAGKTWLLVGRGNTTSSGLLNVTGGSVSFGTTTANHMALNWALAAGGLSMVNVGGGVGSATVTGPNSTTKGVDLAAGNTSGTLGVLNLLANGSLMVGIVTAGNGNPTANLNFNGGTLKATASNAGGSFMTSANIDNVNIYGSGATIDDNGTSITISRPLLEPAGSGIATLPVLTKGSGYIGAPLVTISGTGSGATGFAVMEDDGTGNGTYRVASVTVTCPGVNYTGTPTFSFTGGGPTTAATADTVTIIANTSGGLTKNGSGVLTLSGTSTYKGGTTINAGQISITADTQLGAVPGSPTVNITLNGGTLYKGNAAVTLAANRTISLGASGGYLQPGWSQDFTVNGLITGTGGLGINWEGSSATLNAVNNYQGNTTIGAAGPGYWVNNGANVTLKLGIDNALPYGASAGNVVFGISANNNTATLDFNGHSAQINGLTGGSNATVDNKSGVGSYILTAGNNDQTSTFAGVIKNTSGILALTKTGAGTLTLTGANTYGGGSTINNGTVMLTNSATAGGSGSITVNGSGTLGVNASPTADITYANSVTGAGRVQFLYLNSGGHDIFLNNLGAFSGTLQLSLAPGSASTGGKARLYNATLSGTSSLIIDTGTQLYMGSGDVTLAGVQVQGTGNIENRGAIRFQSGILTSPISLMGDTTFGTEGATIPSGSPISAGSSGIKTLTIGGTADLNGDLTINSAISDGSGQVALNKVSTGILTLSGANSYSGNTTNSAGTLVLGSTTAIGTGTLTLNGGSLDSSVADLVNANGNAQSWNASFTFAGSQNLDLGNGAVTLGATPTVTVNNNTLTVGGAISGGSYGITKAGAGTLTLSGANNTYGGATMLNVGALQLNGAGAMSTSSALSLASGTTLALRANANSSFVPASIANLADGAILNFNVDRITSGSGNLLSLSGALTFNSHGGGTINVTGGNGYGLALGAIALVNNSGGGSPSLTLNATTASLTIASITGGAYGSSLYFKGGNAITIQGGVTNSSNGNMDGYVQAAGTVVTLQGATTRLNVNNHITWEVDGGQLNINQASALPGGNYYGISELVLAGGNIDNTSGGVLTEVNNPRVAINSSFTFLGSSSLNLGMGLATLGADVVATVTNTLTIGRLSGSYGLTKAGSGTITFGSGGTSTISGDLNVTSGMVQIGLNDFTAGGLTGSGTVENGSGATRWLYLNQSTSKTFSGTLQNGAGAGRLGLNKYGVGTLTLAGTNTFTDTFTVDAGALRITGLSSLGSGANGTVVVADAARNATLEIAGGALQANRTTAPSIQVGVLSAANGTVILNSGTVTTASELWLSTTGGGYGALTLNGGTTTVASGLSLARGGGTGVLNVNNGVLTIPSNNLSIGALGAGTGVATLAGGSTTINANGANGVYVGENVAGILSVSGSASLSATGTLGVKMGNAAAASGVLNLGAVGAGGGMITTYIVQKGSGSGIFNFHGGTLKPSAGNANFMTGLNAAYIYGEGAVIDDNSQAITIAQPVQAPTGYGVNAISSTSGSGYIDTPIVTITGGAGSNATAIAQIDYTSGTVTNILITNPGNGYGASDTLTASLVGGGGSGATLGTVSLTANTSGGLAKLGSGTLTLSGVNTYTGTTTVSNGALVVNNTLSSPVTVVVGATLANGSSSTINGLVTLNSGAAMSLTNGAVNTLSLAGGLALSNGNALNFDVGSSSDSISVGGSYTHSGTVTVNITTNTGFGSGTYNLITGITDTDASGFVLGNTIPGYGMTLSVSGTTLQLTVNQLTAAWWKGAVDGYWNTFSSGLGNWATNADGSVNAGGYPGPVADVHFSATGAGHFDTTLGQNFSIKSLTFDTADSVTITNGANALTIGAGGITNSGAAGNNGIIGSGNLVLGADQTWTNGSSNVLTISAPISGSSYVLTKTGSGALTISGTGSTLKTLNLNGNSTIDIGAGSLTINNTGGSTIQSTSGGTINGSGGGVITLAQNDNSNGPDIGTANGTTLTINARLTGTSSFESWNTPSGTGITVLNGANDYTGATIINAGVLSVTNVGNAGSTASALGRNSLINISTPALGSQNSTLRYTGAGETSDRVINFWLSGTDTGGMIDQSGTGLLKFSSSMTVTGTGTKTLTLQGSTAGMGEFAGNLVNGSGTLAVTKAGTGTWTLSGANSYTGATTVNAGMLSFSGSGSLGVSPATAAGQLTVNNSGANSVVTIGANANIRFNGTNQLIGNNAAGAGAVFQSGTVTGVNQLQIGAVTGGSYGYYNLSGSGALTLQELDCGGFNGAPVGVMDIMGGTLTDTSWLIVARGAGNRSVLNMTGGTLNYTSTAANQLIMNFQANATQSAVINVANANFLAQNATAGILNMMYAGSAGEFAAVNLLPGGVMQVQGIDAGNTTGTSHFNFNGGTLKAYTANTTFLTANVTAANVHSGGGTIDNNGVAITILKALTAPTGNGLGSGALSPTSGGSGYVGAPAVAFTGGGGAGATAYATVSGGAVTGIVLTSPGSGYTAPATVVLTGGGGSGYAFNTITPTANTSGGMTFLGSGTTTLTGNNTYGGPTTINNGKLIIGNAGQLNGGSYAGAITNNSALTYNSSAAQTLSGVISGVGSLTQAGSGTLALGSPTNTYSGGTTISGGILMNNAGGNTGMTGTITPFGRGGVTVNSGGRLQLGNNVGTHNNTAFTITNAVTVNGGTLYAEDGIQHLTGTLAVGVNGAILGSTYNNSGADINKGLFLDGVVSGSGTITLQQSGIQTGSGWDTSIIYFANTNTYSGAITVTPMSGTAGGSYLGINAGIALTNATIVLNGNNTSSSQQFGTSPLVFNTGLGTVTLGALAGSGNVILTGYNESTHAYGADSIALKVGGNTSNTTYSGVMSGAGSLSKIGSGTMTLSNTNIYTGATTISNGTLALSCPWAITNSPTISVAAGATCDVSAVTAGYTLGATQTLKGNGTVVGVTMTNSGTLSPGLSVGAITNSGNYVQSASGTLLIELAGMGSQDQLIVTGEATLGGTLTVTNISGYAMQSGSIYTVMTANVMSGAFSATNLPPLPTGLSWSLTTDNGTVVLTVSGSLAATTYWWDANQSLSGVGGTGAWDTNTGAWRSPTTNSLLTLYPNTPSSGDTVVFAGTAGTVTNSGAINVNSMVFTTTGYTLAGSNLDLTGASGANLVASNGVTVTISNSLIGANSVTKSGGGAVVLSGVNSYTGGTTNGEGTVVVGNNAAFGTDLLTLSGGAISNVAGSSFTLANPVNLAAVATVGVAAGDTLSLGGAVTNTGSLTKSGPGTLTLSGSNTYSGGTTVNAGTLSLQNTNAIAASALTLNNNATLQLRADNNATFTPASIANISGSTITVNVDQVTSGHGGKTLTLSGNFWLNANAMLNVTAGSGDTLALGTLSISAGGGNTETLSAALGATARLGGVTASGTYDNFGFSGAGNIDVVGAMTEIVSARWLGLTFNQSGTVTLWAANSLRYNDSGLFSSAGYHPTISFNSGVTVLNHSGAFNMNSYYGSMIYLGAGSGTSAATVLLGGSDGAGLAGGITMAPPIWSGANNSTIAVRDTTSGTITMGGQNTSGVNTWGCSFTLGATANTGKSVKLVAATGGEVDFTGAFLKNGTDATAGITVGDASHAGRVKLTGVNTYMGNTVVDNGTLALSGSGTISNSVSITVSNGAIFDVSAVAFTLGGSQSLLGAGTVHGTVATAVSSSSTIYAGADGTVGTLTVDNTLNLANGGDVYFDISTTAASGNDQIRAGNLTLNSSDTIHVKAISGANALDAAEDYVLFVVTNTPTMSSPPLLVFDGTQPSNWTHYNLQQVGTNIVLHWSNVVSPTVVATVIPSAAMRNQSVVIDARVTPGSSSVTNATVNLSSIGGAAAQVMEEDPGDPNHYTWTNLVATGTPLGDKSFLVTVTDETPRTVVDTATLTVTVGTKTWNGNASDDNWTSLTNWVDAIAPAPSGDAVVFAGSVRTAPMMNTSYSVTALSFDSTAGGFSLANSGGSTLTLAGPVTNNSVNTQTLNLPVALGAASTIFNAASGNLVVGGVISGGSSYSVIKQGVNSLTLTGANTYSGATTVSAGALTLTGALNNNNTANVGQVTVADGAGSSARLNIAGTLNATKSAAPSVAVGNTATAAGAINMTSGAFNSTSELWLGPVANGYGAFTMGGGTATVGSWLCVGRGGNAVLNVSGGTLSNTGANLTIGTIGGNSTNVVTFSGEATVNVAGSVYLPEQQAGNLSVLTVLGNAALNISGSEGVAFGASGTAYNNAGILNLDGGTVTSKIIKKGGGTGSYRVNFNGGTLKAGAATSSFMTGLSAAYLYSGGAVVDDGGYAITMAQPLLAPAGYGVSSIMLTGNGAGYIDTPIVSITGGTGSGATAIAQINYASGAVTNIVVTNPGGGYGAGDILTATFSGGGGGGASLGTVSLAANTSGGLIKKGSNTLTISGLNTYTGPTTVSNGTLVVCRDLVSSAVTNVAGTALLVTNATFGGSLTLLGNASLSLTNGVAGTLTVADGLMLDDGNVLNFDLGAASDRIVMTGGAYSRSGTVTINIATNSGLGIGTYDLITTTGLGKITDTNGFVLSQRFLPDYELALASDGNGKLQVVVGPKTTVWWKGDQGTSWNTSGLDYNWDTDPSSGVDAMMIPNAQCDVHFSAMGADHFNTTLGQNFTINRLTFDTATAVAIGGAYTLTNGAGGIISLAAAGNNTINVSSLVLGSDQTWRNDSANSLIIAAPVNVNGKVLVLTGGVVQIGDGGSIAGVVTNNATLEFNQSGTLTHSGVVAGSGTVVKTGAGTLTLSGVNTYSGATTVSNGTLVVHNNLANSSVTNVAGTALVATNATFKSLALLGSASLSMTNGAAGTLTVANGLMLNNGNVLNFDLMVPAASDKIAVTGGSCSHSGAVTINIPNLGSLPSGTYPLITTVDSSIPSTNGFVVGTAVPDSKVCTLVADGSLKFQVANKMQGTVYTIR